VSMKNSDTTSGKNCINKGKSDRVKISLRDLTVYLGNRAVLDGVNLDIYEGKTLAILGLSGMGKSTLLRSIIRLLMPDKGQVLIEGQDVLRLSRDELYEIRRKMGMVFQKAALFDSMTVAENVGFGLKQNTDMPDEEISQIVSEKLSIVDLEGKENMMPSELSGGMQKRASLARAISTNPEIILYDEPTTGLDPVITSTINKLIMDLQCRFQVTSIIVTHDLSSAYAVADEIAMLHNGKIIEKGTPEEIQNSSNPIVKQFITGSLTGPITVTE
jgi:phospholipid/cholesterol/gamma-HCH transport system ATP-binding protein